MWNGDLSKVAALVANCDFGRVSATIAIYGTGDCRSGSGRVVRSLAALHSTSTLLPPRLATGLSHSPPCSLSTPPASRVHMPVIPSAPVHTCPPAIEAALPSCLSCPTLLMPASVSLARPSAFSFPLIATLSPPPCIRIADTSLETRSIQSFICVLVSVYASQCLEHTQHSHAKRVRLALSSSLCLPQPFQLPHSRIPLCGFRDAQAATCPPSRPLHPDTRTARTIVSTE
ncbi:hypothetical protein K466DRAFT_15321 [Polyporus arcularius HHB13444]|uniref:Uncharacterized protein n=1 Tax=Polyporus arcularius HHB13444 TaxID=1314778 RepID=A0A5C3NQ70_9APHY|nr:hypothetical protein K466DRAFT_15321 [Polyporus arcularius HHB13444]